MKMGPDLLFNPFEDFHGPHIGLLETSSQKTTKVNISNLNLLTFVARTFKTSIPKTFVGIYIPTKFLGIVYFHKSCVGQVGGSSAEFLLCLA